MPKKDKKAAERELISSECGVRRSERIEHRFPSVLSKAVKLLRRFFSGERVLFDLPLDMRYHTAFQQSVWKATREIPFGETRSYGWVAKKIKNPKAVRAVGQALGANPIPIIIP
jgi:O6-methylguanine-DNA--protein-cysteine methyltransferase